MAFQQLHDGQQVMESCFEHGYTAHTIVVRSDTGSVQSRCNTCRREEKRRWREETEPPRTSGKFCPKCFLELPLSGVCGECDTP